MPSTRSTASARPGPLDLEAFTGDDQVVLEVAPAALDAASHSQASEPSGVTSRSPRKWRMHRSGLFWKSLLVTLAVVVVTVGSVSTLGVVGGGLISGALATVVTFLSFRRIASSLNRLTVLAHDLSQQPSTDSQSSDELQRLTRAFEGMSRQLQERMETITGDRNKFLTILRGMAEGVVAVDQDERILHINAAAGRILSTDPDLCVGKPIWEVTRVSEILLSLQEVLEGGKEVTAEMVLVSDLEDQVLVLHAAPLQDARGERAGAVVVLEVLTELRRLEQVRRDFVANVSHELKTPITAIRGFAETLVDDEDMPVATRTRFQGKIRDQAMRLSAVVSDLLTLARLESQEGLVDPAPFDLRMSVDRTVRDLEPTAESAAISVRTDVTAEPVVIVGDQSALEQVTTNLLDNAIKYSRPGGNVLIRLRKADGFAWLEVEDDGVGIEPTHQQRIFERFYRVDKARSRELGGTGLGLSIVKHLCLVHGGNIQLRSVPGQGSTFTVRLPLQSAAN